MTKTYNIDAYGLPETAVAQISRWTITLGYSRHALTEALNDRYGVLPASAFPVLFSMNDEAMRWKIVEIEESAPGYIAKFVVRREVDARRSLVLVIIPHLGLVKTLWTNLNTDNHSTLDKSKFSQP